MNNQNKNTKANLKAYLKSLKKVAPWALGGTAVGLGASIIIPSVALSGLGGIRIIYSTAKLTNKVVSKVFLKGEPTPVDKVIDTAKLKIENKFGNTKIYKGIQKINNFLKKPQVQWFMNGMAVGYTVGNALNLHDKAMQLKDKWTNNFNQMRAANNTQALNNNPAQNVSGNDAPNVSGNSSGSVSGNDAIQSVSGNDVGQAFNNTQASNLGNNMNPSNVTNTNPYNMASHGVQTSTPNYDWLNTGENVDLSGVKRGFTDSIKAMSDTGSVHLQNALASGDNGTFIKWLKLPDGTNFTGNIGELLETGIDPNTVAARIMNQNGDYAWMNLQDILDAYSNTAGKVR